MPLPSRLCQPDAVADMEVLCSRHGPAPGAFFIDLDNAFAIQGFIAFPG